MKDPLVSVIVTTYNNTSTLDACLQSIKAQDYPHIELIVVDNNSTDDTKAIAARHTRQVYNKGPERSAQRNYGVSLAKGSYAVIIDSDMELSEHVISECVEVMGGDPAVKGVIIPEESFGQGFWAQCKRLERSFYVGVNWIEAARFFDKETYIELGGYNESLVSGEDWDLSQRVGLEGKLARIESYIFHNEGRLSLMRTLRKKYYYAGKFAHYLRAHKGSKATAIQAGPFSRYKLFFSRPSRLIKNPFHAVGMLFMKTCEFGIGAVGYLGASLRGDK